MHIVQRRSSRMFRAVHPHFVEEPVGRGTQQVSRCWKGRFMIWVHPRTPKNTVPRGKREDVGGGGGRELNS